MSAATGRWLALVAAYLGWLFDGFEMGIFGVVGPDALKSMMPPELWKTDVNLWYGMITALFLIGAAAGLLVTSRSCADVCYGDPCQCSSCSWCVCGRVVVPCPVPLPILPFASDIVAFRTAIGLLRSQLALAPYVWTREIIAPGTWINSRDIIDLRVALNGGVFVLV